MAKKWRNEAERHAFFLSKSVDKAIREHNLIEEGDRVLVGVSGGKDSMSLLRLLIHRLKQSPVKYELVVAHVKGDARGPDIALPDSFAKWLEDEAVTFHVRDLILDPDDALPLTCDRCARSRRRTLFTIAEELGCNKIALGHHLEDFAHTALMNLFQHGRMETMAFRRDYFGGKFAVIRPLAYIRENDLVRFAKVCEFPIVIADCPVAPTTCRQSARDLMKNVSKGFRQASSNIVRAATGQDI